jgi:hypothetical protein
MAMPAFLDNFSDMSTQLQNSFPVLIITNFTLAVDIFFLLSGTLTAFAWFRRINRMDEGNPTNTHNQTPLQPQNPP